MIDVEKIAEVVLYEGYLLYPYRHSAMKNQQRWTFGGVYPRTYSEAGLGHDPWQMQTQCLVQGGESAAVDVKVRFLQVIDLDGREEALERAFSFAVRLGEPRDLQIDVPGVLAGHVDASSQPVQPGVHRFTVSISNTTPCAPATRAEALRHTFVSTHTILRAMDGAFVSLLEPPDEFRVAAEACQNIKTWPVLVGEPGERHTLLSSPIILYDYPQISPQTPGELFEATEIDELLRLSILALTDDEKREMRASGDRARQILDRTEGLSPDQLLNLHGVVRELR